MSRQHQTGAATRYRVRAWLRDDARWRHRRALLLPDLSLFPIEPVLASAAATLLFLAIEELLVEARETTETLVAHDDLLCGIPSGSRDAPAAQISRAAQTAGFRSNPVKCA
jgi:hypothetical protein